MRCSRAERHFEDQLNNFSNEFLLAIPPCQKLIVGANCQDSLGNDDGNVGASVRPTCWPARSYKGELLRAFCDLYGLS